MKAAAAVIAAALLLALVGVAGAEVVQRNGVRVSFDGSLSPKKLPRDSTAPISVKVAAGITPVGSKLPQLTRMSISINRYGRLDATGLPLCSIEEIQPATTPDALAACRSSLVGEGSFSAKVFLKGDAPFPSNGKVHAFYGTFKGKPAILAHVYGTQPAPTSLTMPFVISKGKGTFGTVLEVALPEVTAGVGYITGISLNLHRNYTYRGQKHAFLAASCPAPKGFGGATFSFAKAQFSFAGGSRIGTTVVRNCHVR